MKYWIDPKITYRVWKKVCDKFPDEGPRPKEIDRILWEMLRDRQINVFLENSDDPIRVTLKDIPKKAIILRNARPSNK